jgi:hypothetical protein
MHSRRQPNQEIGCSKGSVINNDCAIGRQPHHFNSQEQTRRLGEIKGMLTASRLYATVQGALVKIDGLTAASTGVFLVELVGEDLFACTTFGTFADERFQIFKGFIARAMLGCRHSRLLCLDK